MKDMVKKMGGALWTERLKSSRNPFFARVDETVPWIQRVVGRLPGIVFVTIAGIQTDMLSTPARDKPCSSFRWVVAF